MIVKVNNILIKKYIINIRLLNINSIPQALQLINFIIIITYLHLYNLNY